MLPLTRSRFRAIQGLFWQQEQDLPSKILKNDCFQAIMVGCCWCICPYHVICVQHAIRASLGLLSLSSESIMPSSMWQQARKDFTCRSGTAVTQFSVAYFRAGWQHYELPFAVDGVLGALVVQLSPMEVIIDDFVFSWKSPTLDMRHLLPVQNCFSCGVTTKESFGWSRLFHSHSIQNILQWVI